MRTLEGQPILTAAEMRAAEDDAIADGATVESLIARAGAEVAEAVRRLASGSEVLILCGPGNNGGDGYLAATRLAAAGHPVRVAALREPGSDAAKAARARWTGPVETIADAKPAPVLVDALFGTGLKRPLESDLVQHLTRLTRAARLSIAVDLPSGVGTDDGACPNDLPVFDLVLALGAAKPAHILYPAAALAREVRLLDIGIAANSDCRVIARPILAAPSPADHKYSRGMVAVIAGAMPGATALAANAAAHAGAGYVLLIGSATDRLPHAVVRRRFDAATLADPRIGAIVIGPGLGRGDTAHERLGAALATSHRLVIDGDALHLLDLDRLREREAPTILTPHAGEFAALFEDGDGSKIDRTRAAARASGATIVFKGADTIIANPDGQVRVSVAKAPWLSTAGTGDVLAGAIAAQLAGLNGMKLPNPVRAEPVEARPTGARGALRHAQGDRGRVGENALAAASAGVWLHSEAARLLGPAFTADDLAAALPRALSQCL